MNIKEEKKTGYTFRGKEILLTKTMGRPTLFNARWKKGFYTEDQKLRTAAIFAATGDFMETSRLVGVPHHTIRQWYKQQWFKDLLEEVRGENNEKIDSKFTEIMDGALDQLKDRIVNGDHKLNMRTGEVVRVPVSARDLSIVTAINVDKRQLLRGKPTQRTETISDARKLERLASNFERLAKGQSLLAGKEVVDGDFVEVPKDQVTESVPDAAEAQPD